MKEKIAFRTFFGFIIALALTACRVGKEYQRPPVELPQQFRGQSFADTNSIADIEWKQFFTDTALQRLIQLGLNYNQDLLIAVKRMEVAEKRLQQSKLLSLPDLNFQLTAQYSRPSDNSLNGISIKSFFG